MFIVMDKNTRTIKTTFKSVDFTLTKLIIKVEAATTVFFLYKRAAKYKLKEDFFVQLLCRKKQ